MSIIAVLIFFSLLLAAIFLGAFFWSVRGGQYDDTYTPSVRMLFENKPRKATEDEEDDTEMTKEDFNQ